jgi:hypothetical protein
MQDKDQRVNCAAFIGEFLRLGSVEHKKFLAHERECQSRIEERKKKYNEKRMATLEKLKTNKISPEFTEEEQKRAYEKFAQLAMDHDVYNSASLQVCVYMVHVLQVMFLVGFR